MERDRTNEIENVGHLWLAFFVVSLVVVAVTAFLLSTLVQEPVVYWTAGVLIGLPLGYAATLSKTVSRSVYKILSWGHHLLHLLR